MIARLPAILKSKSGRKSVPNAMIGLDLGESALKAVLLRRDGRKAVVQGVSIRALSGEEPALDVAAVRDVIDPLRARNGMIRCVVSQGRLLLRHLDLPPIPADKIRGAVRLNRRRYVPAQYEGYRIDAVSLGTIVDDEGETKGVRALLAGAPAEEIEAIHNAIDAAGYRPGALDVAPLAVFNAFERLHEGGLGEDAFAVIDFGRGRSFLSILAGGELRLVRRIDFGGETLTREIASRLGFDRDAAEELKLSTEAEIEGLLDPVVQGLCREVRSSLQFVELHCGVRVARLHATGGAAASSAFVAVLGRHLGIPVERWDPGETLAGAGGINGADGMRLAGAIGAALGGLAECPSS